MTQQVIGVLGVGALGGAIVTGLCRDAADPPPVLLSPRGEQRARALAAAYDSVSVAADNQAVLDGSDLVLVCLRQADAGLLDELTWRDGHVVVSAVAGLSADALAVAVAPATTIARAVPMVAVADRAWATPVRPPVPQAMALFERTGGAIGVGSDEQYDAIYTGLGTVAPFFDYLASIEGFLTDHGLPVADARRLLADCFTQVVAPLGEQKAPDFAALLAEHAPAGGGNDQLATLLREAGVPGSTRRALDEVHRRQTGR